MGPEQLRDLLRRQPFVPIRLYISDGTTYDIRHPEMALLTRTTIDVGIEEDEPGSGIADSILDLSLGHVVKAERVSQQVS